MKRTTWALSVLTAVLIAPGSAKGQQLEFHQHVAADPAFHVNSVLIAGPTEAVLIDTQFLVEDARAVADQIAASGRRLKAIFITHPDHDHFSGAAVIVERFPGTPVYMTEAAHNHFEREGRQAFLRDKERRGEVLADSVATPQTLPSPTLTVDGVVVEIIPDLQGDVLEAVNSVVWVPSERTLIASDLVFNGVHVWLGASNVESRERWSADLKRLQELGAERVIPGHKPAIDVPDTPDALTTMIDYLKLFDEVLDGAVDAAEVWEQVAERYPWAVEGLLRYSAQQAVRARDPATATGQEISEHRPVPETRRVEAWVVG